MIPADDERQVRDLVARYVEAVALFDVELYRSVWSPDAEWVVDGRGTYVGPDDITDVFVELRAPQELAVQRITSGRCTGGSAGLSGRWVIHSLTRTDGVGSELVGVYDDEYVLADGSWRFRRRAFSPLYRGRRDLGGRAFAPPRLAPLAGDDG